ncbi:hypothetical protein HDV00_011382 [Rhizophlyctis rosea]|nr:hypothetical protein HDV00_011382 [Rhizophlyctis rosea]
MPSNIPITVCKNPPPLPQNWPRHNLTEDQTQKLETLKTHVPALLASGSSDPAEKSDEEKWLDDACLLRYLRATKWHTDQSVTRLEKTLKWRREYKPHKIPSEDVEPEGVTGKELITGFDHKGRPNVYLIPKRENSKNFDRQLRFVVWNLEKTIKIMPPGVESMNLLIDYDQMGIFNAPSPAIAKEFLQTLGDHYPERLGLGFMINPTWYLWAFFKIITPFMDPVTRAKVHFVDLKKQQQNKETSEGMGGWTNLLDYIDEEQLLGDYGGGHDFVYKHEDYWGAYSKI